MNTFLLILGAIFLALLLVFVGCLALLYLWAQRLSEKLQNSKDNIEQTNFNSQSTFLESTFLDLFYEIPILGNLIRKQLDYAKEGINYFNNSIPLILSAWNSQELVTRSTRQFLDSLEAGEPEKSFKSHFDRLGKLKEYKGIRSVEGNDYLAEAAFEKGLVQIQVQLAQDEDKWLINNFKVNYLFQVDSN